MNIIEFVKMKNPSTIFWYKLIGPQLVCVNGHRYVRYFWIMRWWCYNIGHWPLQNLGSVTYCYIAYFLNPPRSLLLLSDVIIGGGILLLSRPPSHQRPTFLRTGSSAHQGITRLCTIIPRTPRPPPLNIRLVVNLVLCQSYLSFIFQSLASVTALLDKLNRNLVQLTQK